MKFVLLAPPVLGALIGYITNVVAVELLFHPKKPINVFGFKIQGLVPARSRELTERFLDTLSGVLTKEDFEFVINRAVDKAVDESKVAAGLNYILSKPPLSNVRDFAEKVRFEKAFSLLPAAISRFLQDAIRDAVVKSIANNIDLKEFVIKKAEEINEEEVERLFKKFAKKELRFIEISGAILGFVIGIVQSTFMYFFVH